MLKRNPVLRAVLTCLTVCVLITAFSPQAPSLAGDPPDDLTNEDWSFPEDQVDDRTAPRVQTAGESTNEGLSTAHRQRDVAPSVAFADYTNWTSFSSAAGRRLSKITFTEVRLGTRLAKHYHNVNAEFTDGDDVTERRTSFITDEIGVNGDGRVHLRLTEPATAIGSDYPGALTIEIWDRQGGTLLYTSSDFGGMGSGHFGGVVGKIPFTFVVLRDWVDDKVYLDNIYLKDDPAGSDYRDLPAFKAAARGCLTSITFTEVRLGTTLTTHYLKDHTVFTDGDDVTQRSSNFLTDEIGVKGDGRVHLRLTEPATAIGADYPGGLTIELWDHKGGTLLYTSSDFGKSGSGFFGGVVASSPFSFVVLRDWVDDKVYLDNIHIRFEGDNYCVYLPAVMNAYTAP